MHFRCCGNRVETGRVELPLRVINARLAKLQAADRTQLVNGDRLLLQGDYFTLLIVDYSGKAVGVEINDEKLIVRVNTNMPPEARQQAIRQRLERFYRNMAREAVMERLEYFKNRLGVDFGQVRIKAQKTRWGSCSSRGNLNFNWKLVMAPSDIIDYVVVHELCHLKHMNHSQRFWSLVEKEIPDYRARKKWLREHTEELSF